ncbi:ABC transporter substrate-binding protein [Metabacillus sp. GX 13764]|uniref:ABC transporter substrate-binding protein n=1 Tax=Metabacillus kandeliae TaxID=2900151 RepID=UPI001E5355BD|nr:ABC transporter substrate-binding protein [Metabacillus kandeliae]MCD7036097.1 ABC transporter substrate-binding protein [Metabacillus kandeliae]
MNAKKWLAGFGISAMLLGTALTGCSNSGKDASAPAKGEKVQITLAGWGSSPEETKLLDEILKDFESSHPNIDVKRETIADQYMDVIKTRLIGGQGPDVFYLDAFEAPGLIQTGVVEPLDSYIKKDFDVADFEKPMIKAFQKDGKTYGFPKGYSTLAMFYNKKMFKDAGVEVPKTWEEFQAAAKKLTKGKEVYGFGASPELARLYNIGESKGGKVATDNKATFADPKVVAGLQPVVDMHNKDKSAAEPKETGATWTGEMFGQGKAAMVFEGNWAIPYLKSTFPDIDYGTAELPTIDGKKSTMAYTVSYVMNASSQKKEASWELISYLTGKEGMKKWTSKGFELPTRKSVATELGYDKDELRGPLVKGAPYATVWADDTNLPIIFNNFNNQFISAFLGEKPLDQALKQAQDAANKEIDNQK